jgi:hypothetical protein
MISSFDFVPFGMKACFFVYKLCNKDARLIVQTWQMLPDGSDIDDRNWGRFCSVYVTYQLLRWISYANRLTEGRRSWDFTI